jgi:quercetin dioxygenase-like cupin family protein
MYYQPDKSGYRELLPGVTMKPLTHGEKSLLCEIHFVKGALIPEHEHPHEQTGYLISGSLRFFGDEGEKVVTPGHSWNFKGGVKHGAEALEESVVIEVFSPVRDDYMPQE